MSYMVAVLFVVVVFVAVWAGVYLFGRWQRSYIEQLSNEPWMVRTVEVMEQYGFVQHLEHWVPYQWWNPFHWRKPQRRRLTNNLWTYR